VSPRRPERYGPPRVRKLRHRSGAWTWIYKVSCGCGEQWYVGGTHGMALRSAREHWDIHWPEWAA
jgi:hypothetical protein